MGGPIALLKNGDMIVIDAEKGSIDVLVLGCGTGRAPRRVAAAADRLQAGAIWKYAQLVGLRRISAR